MENSTLTIIEIEVNVTLRVKLNFLTEEKCYNIIMSLIVTFSEVSMSHISNFIDEIKCWPILILIGFPCSKIIIECYRIGNAKFFYFIFDAFEFSLECKFRCMNTDDDQSLIFIFLIKSLHMRNGSLTIDTTKCPEVY